MNKREKIAAGIWDKPEDCPVINNPRAAWRARPGTAAQRRLIESLAPGYPVPETSTRGELSDLIGRIKETRVYQSHGDDRWEVATKDKDLAKALVRRAVLEHTPALWTELHYTPTVKRIEHPVTHEVKYIETFPDE